MTADKGIEERLTPAARAALDSYLDDARTEILNGANAIAASLSDYTEIGVSEILQAIRSQQGQRERDQLRASELRSDRLRLLTAMVAVLGAVLIVFGAGIFAFQQARFSESPATSWVATSITAGLALFASAFSLYYLTTTRRRYRLAEESTERQERRSLGEFLIRWGEFNRAVDLYVANRFGDSAASPGLGRKLTLLEDHRIFTPEDAEEVKRLYNMRNRLVHGVPGEQPTQEQVETALNDLQKLQQKVTRDKNA